MNNVMQLPAFYDQAPHILMRDPLAAFLGAADDGLLDYAYADAVRLAGHSCPTVAGAWLMVRAGLQALYPQQIPERGGVTVQMPAPEGEGTNGVIAQIFTLITGAAAANGFHGIGGRFARQALLDFSATSDSGAIRLTRGDNHTSVGVELDMTAVPAPANLRRQLGDALNPDATVEQRASFAHTWQERVRCLLLDHADDPRVIKVTTLN